jgi:hypothetical protein
VRRLLLGALLVATTACTHHATHQEKAVERTSPTARAERSPTRPHQKVVLEVHGPARAPIVQAVADVRSIGFWDRLTDDLFEVQLDARFGKSNIPRDEHLADAYYTVAVDPDGGGSVCDIMFFPTSIANDLARWNTFYAQGRIARPPPASLRQYYASLLAHELGHCQPGPRGEPVALRWERRTVAAMQKAGIE